jgi:hypothetical protein
MSNHGPQRVINGVALLGLTLWRPWSDVVASGEKLIENRPWAPPRSAIGRLIAIHGGKVYDQEGAEFIRGRGVEPLPPDRSRLGIVGLVRIAGVVRESPSPWFFGPFGWVLEHVRELAEAVPCKGAMGLWRVPEDVARLVLASAGVAALQEPSQRRLIDDSTPVVEVDHRAPPTPTVRCPCALDAPRVMVGVGRDLHHCACGRLLERWHCCGAVVEPPAVYGYRERDVCAHCGHDRRGAQVAPNMIGTLETVRSCELNTEEEE